MLIYCFNTLDNVQEQLSEIKNIITSSPNKTNKMLDLHIHFLKVYISLLLMMKLKNSN